MRECDQFCYHSHPHWPPNGTGTMVECRQGLLRYQPDDFRLPYNYSDPHPNSACRDLSHEDLKPIVKRDLTSYFNSTMKFTEAFLVDRRGQTQNFTKVHGLPWGEGLFPMDRSADGSDELDDFDFDDEPDVDENDEWDEETLAKGDPQVWMFGDVKNISNIDNTEAYQSLMIDWAFPTLWYDPVVWNQTRPGRGNQNSSANPRYVQLREESDDKWQIFVIAGQWEDEGGNKFHAPLIQIPGAAHPIHLHGHDSVILYQSKRNESFVFGKEYPLQLDNPARRDVIMLPARGFIIMGFRKDNPGAWLMHCHIAWHASAGLSLQIIESPKKVSKLMQNADEEQFKQICNDWHAHEKSMCPGPDGEVAQQEDSGI